MTALIISIFLLAMSWGLVGTYPFAAGFVCAVALWFAFSIGQTE